MLKKIILISTVLLASISCQKKLTEEASSGKYLYVASGLCYSGNGITTFTAATASNLVYRIDTSTGQRESLIADYQAASATAGDTPTSLEIWNENELLVLVRNGTTGRVIEVVPKSGGTRSTFALNPNAATILATAPASMTKTSDGGLLIARTGFIERVSSTGVRQGAPWVGSGATCGAANANLTAVLESKTAKILTANAATGQSRTFSVVATGGNVPGSCMSSATPVAGTAFPTALVYDTVNGKLIVSYSSWPLATDANVIYSYDFNEDTGAISNRQLIYNLSSYPATYNYSLFGISAMALDVENGSLYVSAASTTPAATIGNFVIEKLNYNPGQIGVDNTKVLTKSGTLPFYGYGVDTKCISSMKLGN